MLSFTTVSGVSFLLLLSFTVVHNANSVVHCRSPVPILSFKLPDLSFMLPKLSFTCRSLRQSCRSRFFSFLDLSFSFTSCRSQCPVVHIPVVHFSLLIQPPSWGPGKLHPPKTTVSGKSLNPLENNAKSAFQQSRGSYI